MSRCQKWTPALLLMALFAIQSTACNAEPPAVNAQSPTVDAQSPINAQSPSINATSPSIGVAASVKPSAEAGVAPNFQPLSSGNELHASETVRTGNVGEADLMFIDRSNLSVGSTSEVALDKFVYDPVGSAGQVIMQTPRGTFRLVITGTQDSGAYQLKTPYGTLNVRGQ